MKKTICWLTTNSTAHVHGGWRFLYPVILLFQQYAARKDRGLKGKEIVPRVVPRASLTVQSGGKHVEQLAIGCYCCFPVKVRVTQCVILKWKCDPWYVILDNDSRIYYWFIISPFLLLVFISTTFVEYSSYCDVWTYVIRSRKVLSLFWLIDYLLDNCLLATFDESFDYKYFVDLKGTVQSYIITN